MNELTLRNNEGQVFDFFFNEQGASIQVKDKFGTDLGVAPFVYLNDISSEEMEMIETSEENDRETLITQFLQNRFERLGQEASATHKVQCYNYEGKLFVVFDRAYGIQGAGKNKNLSFFAGVTEIVTGILIANAAAAATVAALPVIAAAASAGFVAAGAGSLYYAIKTPEEKVCAKDLAIQSGIAFVAGATGGSAGLAVNAGLTVSGLAASSPLLGATVAAASSSAASTTAATFAEAAVKQDPKVLKRLTPKKIAASAASGILMGGMNTLAKGLVDEAGKQIVDFTSSGAMDMAAKTTFGAIGGAASSSAVKLTENLIKKCYFLEVTYEAIPIPQTIEQGKLYLFLENETICFLSINEHSRAIKTCIQEQAQFLIDHDEETDFNTLKAILKSQGRKALNNKQKKFILENAALYQHLPASLMSGISDAAVVGGSTGAVVALTNQIAERWKRHSLPEKHDKQKVEANQKKETSSSKRKREGVEQSQQSQKRRAASRPSAILGKKPKPKRPSIGQEEELEVAQRKRKLMEELKNQPLAKKAKSAGQDQETCALKPASQEEIAEAEKNANKAQQRLTNYLTLFFTSPEDLWDFSVRLFDNAKNAKKFGTEAVLFIEKELADYGIPMGTLTSSLQEASKGSNPDEHVPKRIFDAIAEELKYGTNSDNIKHDALQASQYLESLKEPRCVIPGEGAVQPTPLQVDYNILAMDIENAATASGNPGNLNVQMRILCNLAAGSNIDLFNQLYDFCLQSYLSWAQYNGDNKPTQYGFLVSLIDLMINGKPTVEVEAVHLHSHWYDFPLKILGKIGFGFQTNGSNLSVGTKNQPDLVSVYSPSKPVQINEIPPPPQVPTPLPIPSLPDNGDPSLAAYFLGPIQPSEPSTVPFPAMIPTQVENVPAQANNVVPNFSPHSPVPPSPTPQSIPVPPVPNHEVTALPNSLNNAPPKPTSVLNDTVSTAAKIVEEAVKQVDAIPHMDGVGSYFGAAINKVTTTISTLDRINDPAYQDEPAAQQIGCGIWGQVVETTGEAIAGALAGPPGAIAAAKPAQNAGDHAQQNCHEVIDMFK